LGWEVGSRQDPWSVRILGRRLAGAEAFIRAAALAQQLARLLRIAGIKLGELGERSRKNVGMMELVSVNVLGGVKP
jgi:hypothetical protein